MGAVNNKAPDYAGHSEAPVFPIKLRCRDEGWGAHQYQNAFLAAKPKNETWYGYDTNILSPTDLEFIAYDMRDSISGGIGKEIFRAKASVSSSLTNKDVERKIMAVAADRRQAEIDAAEAKIIASYADAIRAALAKAEAAQ